MVFDNVNVIRAPQIDKLDRDEVENQTIGVLMKYAKLLLERMYDGVLVLSSELRIQVCNLHGSEILGLNRPVRLNQRFAEVVQSDELEGAVRGVMQGSDAILDKVFTIALADNTKKIRSSITRTRACLGTEPKEPDRVLMVFKEISEDEWDRLGAEVKILQGEGLLRQTQAVARIGSWCINPSASDPEVLELSEEAYRLFGLPADKRVTCREVLDRIHPADREGFSAIWQEAIRGGGI